MLGSLANSASGDPIRNSSLGSSTGRPRTLRTKLKTSRTRRFSGKISRTLLHRSDSESPGRFAQMAATLRSGSRNSSP
eukprot:15465674-Alexandrium_andersonii.AAC.1